MTDFLEQKCTQRAAAMSEAEVQRHLAQFSGWHLSAGAIALTIA